MKAITLSTERLMEHNNPIWILTAVKEGGKRGERSGGSDKVKVSGKGDCGEEGKEEGRGGVEKLWAEMSDMNWSNWGKAKRTEGEDVTWENVDHEEAAGLKSVTQRKTSQLCLVSP